jgi:proteasome accessory factor C
MSSNNDRMSRLLFIVPYVASRDGVPLAELAEKLDTTPAQIEADLDLLSMVGQPPLTPDHLIDLYVEDDVVYVDLDQSLSRPPRLSHEEARALVLGAKLVGRQGGLGAVLERVLERITSHLNPVDREAVRALSERVGLWQDSAASVSADLQHAIGAHHQVEVDYYSASSDEQKHYTLKPLALVTHGGIEYLVALDGEHEKLFRLDRMGEVRHTVTPFSPPEDLDLEKFRTDRLYFGGGFTARVRFDREVAGVVAERFPAAEVTHERDGALCVSVTTSSTAWLLRWVLPFGTHAQVLGPNEVRAAARKLCAEAAKAYGA